MCNQKAVDKSKELLALEDESLRSRVRFYQGDASDLQFEDKQFDLVICGGANSFIEPRKREKALAEYRRVLKPYGFLSVTNLFYGKRPTEKILDQLKAVLGFEIQAWRRSYWLNLLPQKTMNLYDYEEVEMSSKSYQRLTDNVKSVLAGSPQYNKLDKNNQKIIYDKWFQVMKVFNDNHRYLSFMIVLLRNDLVLEQDELFIEKGASDSKAILLEEQFWD